MQPGDASSEETLSQDPAVQTKLEEPSSLDIPLTNLGDEKTNKVPGYTVRKFEDQDDAGFLSPWKNWLFRLAPLTSVCSLGAYGAYLAFRIKYTLDAQNIANTIYAMAWVFLVVEAGVAIPTIMSQTWHCCLIKGRYRPKLRILGENVPSVDVFITCSGKEIEVIMDTVRAAAAIDWPRDKFRVVVLDDGGSDEFRWEVQALGSKLLNVHYTARTKLKHVPHHFKAGNLNHGLKFVEGLEGGKGEYIAALDADMIAEPGWLRAILPHLISDPRSGLACPPQLFYNVPKGDSIDQSLDFFFHSLESIKDRVGVAWCTESGYAIRRTALDQLGGFPTGSVAEDVLCSSLLLGAGWKTMYVHEPLQYGMVPDSFVGHIKQRTRWTVGTLQTSARLNFFLFGRAGRKMGLLARYCGLVFSICTILHIATAASLLIYPIVLVSGSRLVAYASSMQLRWLIRLAFFALLTSRAHEWILSLPSGYRPIRRDYLGMYWMSPYHAITIIRSFLLPRWLGGKITTFASSGSINSNLSERDRHTRAPLFRRLKVIWWDGGVIVHVLYILFVLAAVATSTGHAITRHSSSQDRLLYILTHAGWVPLAWLLSLAAFMVPVSYAIRPPAMPDREELLIRSEETGIVYPKKEAKRQYWSFTTYLQEVVYTIVTVYTTVIFIGSWII